MRKITTVVFDLDGTLLDTLDDLANSVNYALITCHYPQRSKHEIRKFLGNGIAALMRRSVPEGISAENYDKAFRCFRQHYVDHCLDLTQPYQGIMQLLSTLRNQQIKMAIVSNKLDPAVQELNERFFKDFISSAVGESASIRRKPNPDAVLAALRALESGKEEAVYVGDSEVDVETAHNAGLPCVGVTWGFRDRDFLMECHPDFLIGHPLELLSVVDGKAIAANKKNLEVL